MKKISKRELYKYANKDVIVQITWDDVFGEQCKDKDEIKLKSLKEDLVVTKTFGLIGRVENNIVEVLQEESSTNCDRTVIPFVLITDVQLLE